MVTISEAGVQLRIERDNPWWKDSNYAVPEANSPRRVYFQPFCELALNETISRAAILLGPRRVGKTHMLKQLIAEALKRGIEGCQIVYVSIDTPIYSGMTLESIVQIMPGDDSKRSLVIFDEIQYLRDWEVHLKDLVDSYKNIKFVASGSASAALKLKSEESGAGRFSDFMLPPLTFYEFLLFLGEEERYVDTHTMLPKEGEEFGRLEFSIADISGLNQRFIDYLNFGGYPEAVVNPQIRDNAEQFIRSDIIEKVLLKDLPALYGITRIQELNHIFAHLAFNAGSETNYESIANQSGISKPTIRKYMEYLESAFLIIKLSCVDDSCKPSLRERNFKIYLNNPSMRAALFAPVEPDDAQLIGQLTECAIFSQWQHSSAFGRLRYARWRNEGEVDIVYMLSNKAPLWIGEIKWSDAMSRKWSKMTAGLAHLIKKHPSIQSAVLTSKTIRSRAEIDNTRLDVTPSALYCYMVGRNIMRQLDITLSID
ncbi:MAG: ATP-binding protein [Rhizobiaceae bacterium]|nr:ATP-binding protein [Rhizobiaceae bacterium]